MRVHAGAESRVVASQARPHLDAREVGAVDGEARQLLLGQLQPDRHRVEAAPRTDQPPHPVEVLGREQFEFHEARQGLLDVGRLLADQLELVSRTVEREWLAMAVQDQPAARRQRLDADAVALRQVAEVVVPDHLQVEQPRDECGHQHQDHDRGREDATAEQALLGPVVLETMRARHGATVSASGA